MHGPKRYTDLADDLPGIGTNILASRLRDLEAHGIVDQADPSAAGRLAGLRADRLRPRAAAGDARAGALGRPVPRPADRRTTSSSRAGSPTRSTSCSRPSRPPGRFEFRVGDEVARSSTARSRPGPIEDPDVVVEGDPEAIYHMFVERRLDGVDVAATASSWLSWSTPPRPGRGPRVGLIAAGATWHRRWWGWWDGWGSNSRPKDYWESSARCASDRPRHAATAWIPPATPPVRQRPLMAAVRAHRASPRRPGAALRTLRARRGGTFGVVFDVRGRRCGKRRDPGGGRLPVTEARMECLAGPVRRRAGGSRVVGPGNYTTRRDVTHGTGLGHRACKLPARRKTVSAEAS